MILLNWKPFHLQLLQLQELYEALQRKFLRQLSSYAEDEEPFPHIFTIDFKDQPFDLFSLLVNGRSYQEIGSRKQF